MMTSEFTSIKGAHIFTLHSVLLDASAPATQPLPSDTPSLLRHLEKNNPEALALARDWDDTIRKLLETQLKIRVYVMHAQT